jgi:hypothetical protein
VEGGYALAPQDFYLFTPEERRQYGIMDIAPRDQVGKLERYYGGTSPGVMDPGLTGLPQTEYPTVPYAPTDAASIVFGTKPIGVDEDPSGWGAGVRTAGSEIGKAVMKSAAAQQEGAMSAMAQARANVPTSITLDDPLAPLRKALAAYGQFGGQFGNYGYGG